MQGLSPTLLQSLRERKVILFAGAGLSMNLGLPPFAEVINQLADELGFDRQLFQLSGDFMSLAEYYYQLKGTIGPLRSWMDTAWHSSGIQIEHSFVHRAIVELEFPLIYTTNYDRWIERAFAHWGKQYSKIANVVDLANAQDHQTQIIKFHGDFEDDDSIVLSESSFFDRMSFESPLDIKLRSDMLGRSVLFIGYSLSDINIRYILYKLQKLWNGSYLEKLRPRSYVFLTRPNIVQEEILRSRGLVPLVSEFDNPQQALEDFLDQLLKQGLGKNLEPPQRSTDAPA